MWILSPITSIVRVLGKGSVNGEYEQEEGLQKDLFQY